jgi:hypothetical protein
MNVVPIATPAPTVVVEAPRTSFGKVLSYIFLVIVVIFFVVNLVLHYITFKTTDRLQTEITVLAAQVNALPVSEPPILKYSVTGPTTPLGSSMITNQLTYISNSSAAAITIVPNSGITLTSNIAGSATTIAANSLAILWSTSNTSYLRVQ